MSQRPYSLFKSHHILANANSYYRRSWKSMAPSTVAELEGLLADLDAAILAKNRDLASSLAKRVEEFGQQHFTRSFLRSAIEFVVAIGLALIIATVIRQVWFEPYKIPTGSMRPSFREQDHLVVSKTAFGINTPLNTSHLLFDPSLIRRAGVVVFSADGLDMTDTDTTYFWLFPAKKRLIKRLMGMPGDTLYFYGGKMYGIDQEGDDITAELNPPWMNKLDHVPYMNFEGKVTAQTTDTTGRVQQIYLRQMNIPMGKLAVLGTGFEGTVYNGKEWIKDDPAAANTPHDTIQTYGDLMGIGNYATARLLTYDQVLNLNDSKASDVEDGVLYLELRHNPSLTYPEPRIQRSTDGQMRLYLPTHVSLIPLRQEHLKALMNHLYTVRFLVKDGRAAAYNVDGTIFNAYSPRFDDVADGTYELYYGKAYSVSWGGVTTQLPDDHPLNRMTPENLQRLFNLGIEMHLAFEPQSKDQINFPTRFAYFRDGDLYVMGGRIIGANDPTLIAFNEREEARTKSASKNRPYIAFKDRGPPLREDGEIDKTFIRTFGVRVPDKHYLMLGDNYARSKDGRDFGFVPEANIQGAPTWILWPAGSRWGPPLQTSYPLLTFPRLIVWSIAGLIAVVWGLYVRWRMRHPLFKKLSHSGTSRATSESPLDEGDR